MNSCDKNGEMQHESLFSTTSNENSHRRLSEFSGRGRTEELSTGSMIAGDFIDSRNAAIRHDLPACGADVPHDETQLAALSNKLAGFDGSGNPSDQLVPLLHQRPYDYDIPRAATKEIVVVKQVGGGNVFNNRKPQRHVAPMEAHGDGMLPLPRFCLRSTLRLPTSVPLGTQNLFPMASPLPRLACQCMAHPTRTFCASFAARSPTCHRP